MSLRRTTTRPRVEGDREQEIRDATLAVLIDVGYDRLTMDAVAKQAKASKATLYRRWNDKAALVIDAMVSIHAGPIDVPDTGSLRGDLLAAFTRMNGLTDPRVLRVFASVLPATATDPALAKAFRTSFLAPRIAVSHAIYTRAQARGEIRDDLDLDLLEPALPGIILHRSVVLGDPPTVDVITRAIDQIILPAATNGAPAN